MSEVKVLESIIEWCGGDKSCAYHAGLHNELERYANSKRSNQAAFIEQQQQRITELEERNSHLESQIASKDAELPKWISVDDRLPEYPDEVLCITSSEVYHIGKFCQLSRLWTKGINYERVYTVTHWMPLPQKEKGGE